MVVWKHQPLRPSTGRVSPSLRAQREQLLRKEGKKQTETNRWRADGWIITHRCFPEAATSAPRLNQQLDLWDGTRPPLLAALTSNKKATFIFEGGGGGAGAEGSASALHTCCDCFNLAFFPPIKILIRLSHQEAISQNKQRKRSRA